MQNNLNGGGGRRQALSSMDFYRRVPKDLTEVGSYYDPRSAYMFAGSTGLSVPLLDPLMKEKRQ